MANEKNKVQFHVKNVHYALITEDGQGKETYETPIPYPGAMELTLDPVGEAITLEADGYDYYSENTNNGYDGKFVTPVLPDHFAQTCLGETLNSVDKTLSESTDSKVRRFALLFEFVGDVHETKHVLYNVSASRPSFGGKGSRKEFGSAEISLQARPSVALGMVKTKTTAETPQAVYDAWYEKVYEGAA